MNSRSMLLGGGVLVGWLTISSMAAASLRAAASSNEVDGAVFLPPASTVRDARGNEARVLREGAVWRRFTMRYGAWQAWWNASTGTPHRALGPPIPLAGYADDAASVDRAVRRFVTREGALFGAPDLETILSRRDGNVWLVRYRRHIQGVPVLFEDWEFWVNHRGGLMAFGFDAHRPTTGLATRPVLPWAVAREAAHAGVPYDPGSDRVEGGALVLVPVAGETGGFRLAYRAQVETMSPRARWNTLVDAGNGKVLWRMNEIHDVVSGSVSGDVHPIFHGDPLANRPFPYAQVVAGNDTVFADAAGNYSSSATGTVTVSSRTAGRFCATQRTAGNASFSQTVTAPATVNIVWNGSNSQTTERDAYYHVNRVHDFVKGLDPGLTAIDYAVPTFVEQACPSCGCQAGTDGVAIGFGTGGLCVDMATLPDVVYHEFGHIVDQHLYNQAGTPENLGVIGEGLADVMGMYVQGDPVMGDGLSGPGTYFRSATNGWHWPADFVPTFHVMGQILSGSLWAMRQSLGSATAAALWHAAKKAGAGGGTGNFSFGEACNNFCFGVLVADDDNGNLSDGTPHFAAINAAFAPQGLGTAFFLDVKHNSLPDQPSPGTYPILATVDYSGPFGAVDGATLYVSINGSAYTGQPMTHTQTNKFESAITVSGPALVRYYIQGRDTKGGTQTSPLAAPRNVHVFIAGAVSTVFVHDQETDQGWTVGSPTDNATTGVWIRDEPVGSNDQLGNVVQPNADHTQSGKKCFVTGNAGRNDFFTTNCVRNGKTTVTTPTFSAHSLGGEPAIEYYRWYGNYGGVDSWQVDISNNNGATWVPVERTVHNQLEWRRIAFMIREYVSPTPNMKLRFVAEQDVRPDAIVEAAVDDFRLFAVPSGGGLAAMPSAAISAAPGGIRVLSSLPFSSAVVLEYSLPTSGEMSLRVYDVGGRMVRDLVRGPQPAGTHSVRWDGRDGAGNSVANGVYFARFESASRTKTIHLVRMR